MVNILTNYLLQLFEELIIYMNTLILFLIFYQIVKKMINDNHKLQMKVLYFGDIVDKSLAIT